jgi:DNA-directed RNA polymerase specialized sigma24 family protein
MRSDDDRDDVELLSVISSNAAALEQFYRRHVDDDTRFLARRCQTSEDVADAVSANFFAVLFSAETLDPTLGLPTAWLGAAVGLVDSLRL